MYRFLYAIVSPLDWFNRGLERIFDLVYLLP